VQMYWLDRKDLHAALRQLANELGLAITDETLTTLDADLEGTWYGSDYVDERSAVLGTWATLRHGADSPRFDLAEDDCAGVFIRMWCDDSLRRRAVEVLARFNPLDRTLG
jgi:hypothetical protein